MFAGKSNPDAEFETDANGEMVFENHSQVITTTGRPRVGRIIEVLGDSEYRVEFGNGEVLDLHASEIGLY